MKSTGAGVVGGVCRSCWENKDRASQGEMKGRRGYSEIRSEKMHNMLGSILRKGHSGKLLVKA